MSFCSLSLISISKGVVASPICDKGWRDKRRVLEKLVLPTGSKKKSLLTTALFFEESFQGIRL